MTATLTEAGDVILTTGPQTHKARVENINIGNDLDSNKFIIVSEALRTVDANGKLGLLALARKDRAFTPDELFSKTYNGVTGLQVLVWFQSWLADVCLEDADELMQKIMPPAGA